MKINSYILPWLLVLIVFLIVFLILSIKKNGKESIFNKRTFILAPISWLIFSISYTFANLDEAIDQYAHTAAETNYSINIPEFLLNVSDSDARIIALITGCIVAVIWIVLLIINIHRYKFLGFTSTIIQIVLSYIASYLLIFILLYSLLAVLCFGGIGILFYSIFRKFKEGPEPPLCDSYGTPINYVRNKDGKTYYVDCNHINNDNNERVKLHKDSNGYIVDDYNNIYYS